MAVEIRLPVVAVNANVNEYENERDILPSIVSVNHFNRANLTYAFFFHTFFVYFLNFLSNVTFEEENSSLIG